MKTDLYTKTVLTVIALCLTVIVLRDVSILPKVQAEAGALPTPSNVAGYATVPVNADGTIDVNIKNIPYSGLPVNIKDVSLSYGQLPVEIKEVRSRIPVEVKNSYIYTKPY